jgi:isorenieratene synthase
MDRRTVLKTTLAAGTLGAVGTGAGLVALAPRRGRAERFGDGSLEAPREARRVVVVGGGLAGMASAATLAGKGYEVVLVERASDLGGKLAGWPIEVLGETVPMEHGFHGFFRQYYNLRALLAEADADHTLVEQPTYTVLFADGREEPFGVSVAPFPLDLLEVLARSDSLGFMDVAGDRPGMNAILAYEGRATFAAWDHLDAASFVTVGELEGPFADLILRPFGQASMNALEEMSAAELIRFFHFYMLGNPEGLGFSALSEGVHVGVLGPLRRHLERLGVDIRTGTPVRRVRFADGRATGVELGAPVADAARIAIDAVPAAGWVAVGPCFVRRTPTGFEARDGRCTHMGCPVQRTASGFYCPCHAGRYDDEARPVAGPPPRPLADVPVTVDGEELVLRPTVAGEILDADAVVLATEVRGLRALAEASDFADHAPALGAAAAAGEEALPYCVARFWFDQPVDPTRTAFYTVAGYPWTDGIATYSAFQQPYVDWAARTGGSVVETHAYAIPPELQGPPSSYRDALLAELRQAFPELATANVLHEEVMAQSNFTRFGPGAYARRPATRTEIDNLFVAGDHVRLPFPAFLMEAAAASGRLAANAVFARDGVEEVPIPTVAPVGKLAGLL